MKRRPHCSIKDWVINAWEHPGWVSTAGRSRSSIRNAATRLGLSVMERDGKVMVFIRTKNT